MSQSRASKIQADADRPLPPNAGKGRPKGVPNRMTRDLRDMILGALDGAGGQAYLQRQADENPVAFMSLVGKVLPKEVTGADGKDLIPGTIRVEWVAPKP